uniref:hypothetical protein n=1 Tax=Escherichia sp. MOD1-EC2449 TaxID=2093859 RepID=UPI001A7E0C59
EKRVFLVILFTSFSGSLVSRIPGAVHPETLSISCEVTFRHGTLRFNGNVSEKLLTLLIQELKR